MRRSGFLVLLPLLQSPEAPPVPKGVGSLAKTPVVSLEQLRKDPDSYLGLRLKLSVVIGGEKEIVNPYFTRFNSTDYIRFSVRSASAPLWNPEILQNEFSHVFLRKDSALLPALRDAKKNELAELTVIVRDSFRSLPWVEIVGAVMTGEWTPEGTLISVARARKLLEEGQRHLAIDQLQQAIVDPLPKAGKVSLLKEIAAIQGDLLEKEKARQTLELALRLSPQDKELQAALRN